MSVLVPACAVDDFLDSLELGEYKDAFRREALDSIELLVDLTAEDLRDCVGVLPIGHRKRIMKEAARLFRGW